MTAKQSNTKTKFLITAGCFIFLLCTITILYFGIKYLNGLLWNNLSAEDKKQLANDTLIADDMLKRYLKDRLGSNEDIKIINNEAYKYFITSDTVWGDNYYDGHWLANIETRDSKFQVWGSPSENKYYDNYQTKEIQEYIDSYIRKEVNLQEAYKISVVAGLRAANTKLSFLKGNFDGKNFLNNIPSGGNIKIEIDFIKAPFSLKDRYKDAFNKRFANQQNVRILLIIRNYHSLSDYNSRNKYDDTDNTAETYDWIIEGDKLSEYHTINGNIQLF